jgi:CRISPR-associated protein Csm5
LELRKAFVLYIGGEKMNSQLKQFEITLLTVGPVHIGSGNTLNSKEYIYENTNYYFPDMGKLYQEIEKQGMSSINNFENFLRNSGNKNNNRKPRLKDLLDKLRIDNRNFGGYEIKGNSLLDNPENINDISQFIRNGINEPYIPGSSLKGAIRTILVNEIFDKDNTRNRSQAISWGAKKNQEFDDIFYNIRVSDSQPISNEKLTIIQKNDYKFSSNELKPLPIFRESIIPRTTIKFSITTEGQEAFDLISNLAAYANNHYEHYKEFFLNNSLPEKYISKGKPPIYIGAGSGVWTKTLMEEADGEVQRRYERMKTKMKGKGLSKLAKYPTNSSLINNNEGLYEMGKTIFILKEIN